MLKTGGNAVDAAVAAAICLGAQLSSKLKTTIYEAFFSGGTEGVPRALRLSAFIASTKSERSIASCSPPTDVNLVGSDRIAPRSSMEGSLPTAANRHSMHRKRSSISATAKAGHSSQKMGGDISLIVRSVLQHISAR